MIRVSFAFLQNSLLQVESNLDVLRSYEKKILDAAFDWFTALPTFVAEQIPYVLDANDLTKLKMFRARIREKIAETETIGLEKFAADSPKDHENFCRIEQKITFLSEAMKSLKKGVAVSSPIKNVDNGRKSIVGKSNASFGDSLFSSDSGSSEGDDDHLRRQRHRRDKMTPSKKLNRKIFSKILDSGNEMRPECGGVNQAPVAALKRSTFDSTDFERLPSTQDIERVFDKWKDSKDQTLQAKRSEKRKRGETSYGKNAPPQTECSSLRASEIDRYDDDDFPMLSDSQLLGLAVGASRSTCDGTAVGADSGRVAETAFAKHRGQQIGNPLDSKVNGRLLNVTKTPEKTIESKLPGRVANSLAATTTMAIDKWYGDSGSKEDDASRVSNACDRGSENDNSLVAAFDKTFLPRCSSRDDAGQRIDDFQAIPGAIETSTNVGSTKFKFKAPCFGGVGVASNDDHALHTVSASASASTRSPQTYNASHLRCNISDSTAAATAIGGQSSYPDETTTDDRLFDELFQSQLPPTDVGHRRANAIQAANVRRNNSSLDGSPHLSPSK